MRFTLTWVLLLVSLGLAAQQRGDEQFTPTHAIRTFSSANAPRVMIDEAHHNFHTLTGRYQAFAKVLISDGYRVEPSHLQFTAESLAQTDILVISNALNENNRSDAGEASWDLPNYPAFTRGEIESVYFWVKRGGALFLIADHMPFPKAAEDLAAIFGFQFNNGYVRDRENPRQIFSLANGQLRDHAILRGGDADQRVTAVRAFTGQGFLSPPGAEPLLVFGDSAVSLMPRSSWDFSETTPTLPMADWHQGETLRFHQGRLVVFGEAAMFTAQTATNQKRKIGLMAEGAEQNERFLLNIMLWLSGALDG